jgi:hypothetical protein
MTMIPNKSPEPTAVGAFRPPLRFGATSRSAVEVRVGRSGSTFAEASTFAEPTADGTADRESRRLRLYALGWAMVLANRVVVEL